MKIKYINYIEPSNATGLITDIYTQMKRDFGRVVEPVALHSIIPELLAHNWSVLRETNVVEDKVKRNVKDAIATAVSKINKCPWCVDAHTIMLIGLSSSTVAKAIENENLSLIEDTKMRTIVEWALANRTPSAKIINNPPFTFDEAPEIIGTAIYYHYVNKMVSVLLNETPLPTKASSLKPFTAPPISPPRLRSFLVPNTKTTITKTTSQCQILNEPIIYSFNSGLES